MTLAFPVAGLLGLLPPDFGITTWRQPTRKRRSAVGVIDGWFQGVSRRSIIEVGAWSSAFEDSDTAPIPAVHERPLSLGIECQYQPQETRE